MRSFIFVILLLALQAMARVPRLRHGRRGRTCDTPRPSAEILKAHKRMRLHRLHTRDTTQNSIEVATYFHVVSSPERATWVTRDMVTKQINALSQAYSPHNITFRLVKTDYTTNRDWATGNNTLARMKKLRKGNYRDLNVYYLTDWDGLGLCPFPLETNRGSDDFFQDGCDINAGSLPGSWIGSPFNLGMTTVHEVGHWFGLFHTFQPSGPGIDWNGPGQCKGTGDFISDTPLQKTATDGCPKKQNSCPNQPGDDDIHNYMDYSDDACYTHFTPNQQARMYDLWDYFRAGK